MTNGAVNTGSPPKGVWTWPIASRLMLSFVLIIVLVSAIFSVVGIRFIANRTIAEAQTKVGNDLNAAREIYLTNLHNVYQVVRFSAERFYLRDALINGDTTRFAGELTRTLTRERLDVLTVLNRDGAVVYRAHNPAARGDRMDDPMFRAVLEKKIPISATAIVPAEQLRRESPALAERAFVEFVDTPRARPRKESSETSGMMLEAAAPIFDYQQRLIGVLCGGVLLNRHNDIVDKVKLTVFKGMQYRGRDIGTATIFQDDVRISTNVLNKDGTRAIGTRVAREVYERVVRDGVPWIGRRAYVVNDWYIAAYEPIRDVRDRIVGILYVGVLEAPYLDVKRRTTVTFLCIAAGGALLAAGLSYVLSARLTVPIKKLVRASRDVAAGDLETRVTVTSYRELAELADAFNSMARALQERDQKIMESTTKRIMESERLAVIGQLSADVAHELNNPLQGVVTYSNLILEKLPPDDSLADPIQKIIKQATRCTTIVRGLLDFARQRKPVKRHSDINTVIKECLSMIENRAIFHNIEIVKKLGNALPQVIIDPSQIDQVFMNIIMNAAEAMEGQGRLTVATRLEPTGRFVEAAFSDTGHGISAENLERIFDPFFTTKPVGHGTGLGLAISYGIIKEHEGTISVESKEGKGTTFTVRFLVPPREGS